MEITIRIPQLDRLCQALEQLGISNVSHSVASAPAHQYAPPVLVDNSPFAPPASLQAPVPVAPVPVAPSAPAQAPPLTAPVTAIPTTAPTYTAEQIMQAAGVFAGRSNEDRENVVALIRQFGVNALAELPVERYGEFVTFLRALGVAI